MDHPTGGGRAPGPCVLVVFALTVLATTGCDSEDPTRADPGLVPGDVAGVVARQKTGTGVADVVVVLRSPDGRVAATTFTDPEGAFSFPDVPDGAWELTLAQLERAGVDPRFDAVEPEAISLELAGDREEVVFAIVGLVPARIVGDVTCDGAPRPGAEVRVVGGDTDRTVTTNPQGRFAVLDLLPGKYVALARLEGCPPADPIRVVEVLRGQFVEVDFHGEGG